MALATSFTRKKKNPYKLCFSLLNNHFPHYRRSVRWYSHPACPLSLASFIHSFPPPPPGRVAPRRMCANIPFVAPYRPTTTITILSTPYLPFLPFCHPSSCLLPPRSCLACSCRAESSPSPLPSPRHVRPCLITPRRRC